MKNIKYISGLLFFIIVFSPPAYSAKKCLHVMSYHKGYAWNDGIEKGVEQTLANKCRLKKFYMDTKRNPSVKFIKKQASKAKLLIAAYKPDIVIASDDNASKYVVTAYKNKKLPFIFCGVNWTAEVYGFPYKNVTGMVEVAPIVPLLKIIKKITGNPKKGVYLSADVITEHKDYEHYSRVYSQRGVKLVPKFVKTMQQWVKAYKNAQTADFIILNNNAGIKDWNHQLALKTVSTRSKKLTVSNYKWMMPYTMFGMTKSAEEQGRWAAEVALEVLSGAAVESIPVTVNRHWNFYSNDYLLTTANIRLDNNTRRRTSVYW